MNKLIEKAEELKPQLIHTKLELDGNRQTLEAGKSAVYDFGNHYTGYFSVDFSNVGSHQDAPVLVKFTFAENKRELDEDTSNYHGWISKSWLQEEILHIDELPCKINLPRRYAFRYARIEVLAMSSKHKLVVDRVYLNAVSSAKVDTVSLCGKNDSEKKIDAVALRTLSECMQTEFEDGPKRDRRLWIGDLRLQALANYETFKDYNLVKRCLYLFAGTTNEEGRVSACIFTSPKVEADDTFMFDYSLFFSSILNDYYAATKDLETLKGLYPVALKQVELSAAAFDEHHVMKDSEKLGWCFLDWNLALNKQAGAQAVYIYAAKAALKMAKILNEKTEWLEQEIKAKTSAAIEAFFDKSKGVFTSGADKQISYAANVWFCLAEVFDQGTNKDILSKLNSLNDIVMPVTPYMYHHYIQALVNANCKDEAEKLMNDYWGGMVEQGADTFWELYNPANPDESPYGGASVNSYCHAWSCTPSYFLRKYF